MKQFRAGIIGCGNISPMHGVSVMQLPNAQVVACCDNKEDRAKDRAELYKCKYYLDYKEMIEKESLDVVHVCLPHYLHAPVTIYALDHGVNVLTEKPMAIKLEDAEAMIEAAKRNNKTLGVIFQNRYNPGSMLAKKTLESGELGKVLSAKALLSWMRSDEYYSHSDWKGTWEKEGGGVIIDQAIHTLDLMRWLIDSPIEYVEASISNRAHSIIEVEDAAEGVVKFENGVVAGFFTFNYYTYDAPVEIEMHCEQGIVKIVSDECTIRFNDGRTLIADRNPNEVFEYSGGKSYWGISHQKQIQQYYNALEKGVKPEIDGEAALKTQRMICAIYDSGKSKQRITF